MLYVSDDAIGATEECKTLIDILGLVDDKRRQIVVRLFSNR